MVMMCFREYPCSRDQGRMLPQSLRRQSSQFIPAKLLSYMTGIEFEVLRSRPQEPKVALSLVCRGSILSRENHYITWSVSEPKDLYTECLLCLVIKSQGHKLHFWLCCRDDKCRRPTALPYESMNGRRC
jgi:hypothetical protein